MMKVSVQKLLPQLSFTKSSREAIRRSYGIAPEDEIIMAIWVTSRKNPVFKRSGFIITKNGLSWKHPAAAEMGENSDGIKEVLSRSSGFIAKNDVIFQGISVNSADEPDNQDGKNEIQLKTQETLYKFFFENSASKTGLCTLERILTAHFSNTLNPADFEKDVCKYSLELTLLCVKDFLCQKWILAKEKCTMAKRNFAENAAARKEQREKRRGQKNQEFLKRKKKPEKKSTAQKTGKIYKALAKFGAFLRHIIDFCADFLLIFAIVIFIKPDLLDNRLQWSTQIGKVKLCANATVLIIAAFVWIILKILISLTCRRNRKALTFLLIAMLIASSLIIAEKFIVFAILISMILLALQFSMGFTGKVVLAKSALFVIAVIWGYLSLHILVKPDIIQLLEILADCLRFPAKWW